MPLLRKAWIPDSFLTRIVPCILTYLASSTPSCVAFVTTLSPIVFRGEYV